MERWNRSFVADFNIWGHVTSLAWLLQWMGEAHNENLEPVCPLFWWLNPPKEGLFQSEQGSFGFQEVSCLKTFFWKKNKVQSYYLFFEGVSLATPTTKILVETWLWLYWATPSWRQDVKIEGFQLLRVRLNKTSPRIGIPLNDTTPVNPS